MVEKRYPRNLMATACIPWKEVFFDEDMFRREVRNLRENGLKSIYTFGTAREGYSVSNRQFYEIVQAFKEETDLYPGPLPMVGIISLPAQETIERIEKAAGTGIKDVQISFPCWGELADNEVKKYFHFVCDRFPDFRFMHYNDSFKPIKK